MPSFIWDRTPQEAYANPYEYDAQCQFLREAAAFLDVLHRHLCGSSRRFHRDDTSGEKAIWMLQVDALESLRDCVELLRDKRHRLAGRLFRDVTETLDLAAFFHSESTESRKSLERWYKDEVVEHSVYRKYVKTTEGEGPASAKRDDYRALSKFTHRTYRSLAFGYTLGAGDCLVYEGVDTLGILIPPHTISRYLALAASLIKFLRNELSARGTVSPETVTAAWCATMEDRSAPRRFVPHPHKA
ncbi:MAG: hypothetical protein HY763_15920 [Planctomycetes bacterium]|nr:hypothetical protein [Planctomycetota bacterium]